MICYLVKESFINSVFNLFDLGRFIGTRGRTTLNSLVYKLQVLRLEVFSIDERRRVTIEQLSLQRFIKTKRAKP